MTPIYPPRFLEPLRLCLTLVLACLLIGSGRAAVGTWTGAGGDNNWTTGLNWGGVAPAAGDGLIFTGATRLSPVNDFAAGTSFGSITFDASASAFTLSGNLINLSGSVTNSSTNVQTISLPLQLDATRTFDAASGNIILSGVLSGAGGLLKAGAQTLTLSGTAHNTYDGVTSVTAGTLHLDKSSNINAIDGQLDISGGAKVTFSRSHQLSNSTVVTLSGAGSVFNGTGVNLGQLNNLVETIAGVSVSGGVFNSSAGGDWTITGAGSFSSSTGSGTVFVGNSGTKLSFGGLTLTGMTATAGGNTAMPNSFTLYGNGGVLSSITVGADGLTLDGSRFNLRRGGTSGKGSRLVLNGAIKAIGTTASFIQEDTNGGSTGQIDLELSGTSAAVNREINVAEATGALTIGVAITNGASTAAGLTKTGLGTLTLSGGHANTYTGETQVNAGTLVLAQTAGVTAVAGNIVVNTGGTLTLSTDEQIADTAGITVAGGTISAWNKTEKIAFYTQTSGGVTASGNSGQVTIEGAMSLQGGNTFTINSSGVPAHFQMGSLVMSGADFIVGGNNGVGKARTALTVGSGGLSMTGRTINLYRGDAGTVLNLNGDFTGSGNSFIQVNSTGTIEPELNLGASTRTFTIATGGNTTLNVHIVGAGGLTKTGDGTLTFTGNLNNTYSGVTTINGGTLNLNQTAGTDAITNGVDVRTGGTLTLTGNEQIHNDSGITVNGGTISSLKTTETMAYYTQNSGGFATSGNTGHLIVTGTVTLAGGNSLTMNSNASPTPPAWEFHKAVLTGASIIIGGSNGAANPKSRLTIGTGGLTLSGRNITMNPGDAGTELYLLGDVTASGTASIALGTNAGANSPEIHLGTGTRVFNITSGVTTIAPQVMDAAAIQKTGNGVLVLSAANTYSGGTTITGGAIRVMNATGSGTGSGALIAGAGTTLSGNGRVAPATGNNISISGTVLVGNPSPTQGETLTLVTSGAGAIELLGTITLDLFSGQGSAGVNDATTADRLVTASGTSLTLGASSILNINTTIPIDAGNSAGWTAGSTWQIFDWSGLSGITGTFSNVSTAAPGNYSNLPNLSSMGLQWDLSNLYTTGSISIVNIVAIPEPSRLGLVLLGMLLLTIRRRR